MPLGASVLTRHGFYTHAVVPGTNQKGSKKREECDYHANGLWPQTVGNPTPVYESEVLSVSY